jgi:excisionase family DNA binding protein
MTERRDLFERITVKAYAAMMAVSQRTVRRWIHEKRVECERIGPKGHWRIKVPRAS